MFQSAGAVGWGLALLRKSSRPLGMAGLLLGGASFAAVVASFTVGPLLLMTAIVGLALWAFVAGVALLRA
ncbi:MAG: hypothetical protein HY243_13955 [Proteobacteria bacterium]|nr:hypothetical protein [Pseudomonadota bacterium]